MRPRPLLLPLRACLVAALLLQACVACAGPAALSDPQAGAPTRAVYAWLRAIWGRQTIAGQQDLTWDDSVDMARRVFDDTGKYPALMATTS